jgi:hypothetical protein
VETYCVCNMANDPSFLSEIAAVTPRTCSGFKPLFLLAILDETIFDQNQLKECIELSSGNVVDVNSASIVGALVDLL